MSSQIYLVSYPYPFIISYDEDGAKCTDYTFFDLRGEKTCFLLAGCNDKKSICPVQYTCTSGAIEDGGCISRPGGTCKKISTDHVRWRCNGVNPYTEEVPVGTACYTQ